MPEQPLGGLVFRKPILDGSRLTIEGSRLKVKDQNSKCASTKLGTGAYKYIASHKYWRYPFHHKSGSKNVLAS
jgi:hypothetical protein